MEVVGGAIWGRGTLEVVGRAVGVGLSGGGRRGHLGAGHIGGGRKGSRGGA